MRRTVVTAGGVVLAVLGLAALVAPALTAELPVTRLFVLLTGAVLVLAALRLGNLSRHEVVEYAETGDYEQAIELPTPGDEFDRRLPSIASDDLTARRSTRARKRVRESLRGDIVETLHNREGRPVDAARQAVDDGTWTDDPVAAAFFTGGPPDLSRSERVRTLLDSDRPYERRARRAIAAAADRLEEGETDE